MRCPHLGNARRDAAQTFRTDVVCQRSTHLEDGGHERLFLCVFEAMSESLHGLLDVNKFGKVIHEPGSPYLYSALQDCRWISRPAMVERIPSLI